MKYAYDIFGWYTGAVEAGPRVADAAPENMSTSDTPGAPRANYTGHGWVELPYSVQTPPDVQTPARAQAWERIKAERDRRTQSGGYQAAGKWFHSDVFSRTQQLGLVLMGAGVPVGLQWKTMDGSFVTMTQALAGQVFAAAAAADQALFTHAEALRAAVEEAEDPASVDITAGWPASYGG